MVMRRRNRRGQTPPITRPDQHPDRRDGRLPRAGAGVSRPGGQGGSGGGGGGGTGGGGGGNGGGGNGSLQGLLAMISNPMQTARNDIRALYNPQFSGLRSDYRTYSNQMGALYDILGRELERTGRRSDRQYGNINDAYSEGVQGILGGLEQTTAPDQAAFLNSLGAMALSGSRDLGTMASNEARYNASMGRQADIESMILQRNASGALRDAMGELREQRGLDFRQLLDQRRAEAFDRLMALKQFGLNRQLTQAQIEQMRKNAQLAASGGQAWGGFVSGLAGDILGGQGGGGGGGGTTTTGGYSAADLYRPPLPDSWFDRYR